ncbi:MAG TPA: hypothetical protein VMZ03_00615 [Chitinophagaceae bacterium]|nr:hypothetical protein [Chitinophagaceae bacterium]
MKTILSERNIVVILFVMVLITFSLAQEDSKKKLTKMYSGVASEPSARFMGQVKTVDNKTALQSEQ